MSEPGRSPGDVQIRAVVDDDLEALYEHQRDPVAVEMAVFPARERPEFMAHWAKIRADPTCIQRTVVVDDRVAGNVVCWEQSGRHLVGYWIGRDFWGRGIASKALALLVDELTTRPLFAYVEVHNVGSIRVLEKCGFRRIPITDIEPSEGDADDVEELLLVLD
jgi:RimJ/RimL family protein N-acetyltransferase